MIIKKRCKTLLTPLKAGNDPHLFTHTLTPYGTWGENIMVKTNAPKVLHDELARMSTEDLKRLRIVVQNEPYQEAEEVARTTHDLLVVLKDFPDIDLLMIKTRSLLVKHDIGLIRLVPGAWLSFIIETNNNDFSKLLGIDSSPAQRLSLVASAADLGLNTQIVVSPAMPFLAGFAKDLVFSNAKRIIVDDTVPATSSVGLYWDEKWAKILYSDLEHLQVSSGKSFEVKWLSSGICDIAPRFTRL